MNHENQFCGQPVKQGDLSLIHDLRTRLLDKEQAEELYRRYVWSLTPPDPKKLYLIGSLRNAAVPALASRLRTSCPDVEIFDDWYAAGPEADDWWKRYEQSRYGTDAAAYQKGLEGYAAGHVFEFDKEHIDTSTHALLMLPAGKSGHMEITYALYGAGCDCAILLEQDADPRWDLMYKFIPNIFKNEEEVVAWLNE